MASDEEDPNQYVIDTAAEIVAKQFGDKAAAKLLSDYHETRRLKAQTERYHFPVMGRALMMGDLDRSLRIDLTDIAGFQRCFTSDGPTDVSPCCRIFDFALDADVDLDDVAEFHLAITGP